MPGAGAVHPIKTSGNFCHAGAVNALRGAKVMTMELMMSEVRPRVERALGALTRNAAD
jgi:hypothetical protein